MIDKMMEFINEALKSEKERFAEEQRVTQCEYSSIHYARMEHINGMIDLLSFVSSKVFNVENWQIVEIDEHGQEVPSDIIELPYKQALGKAFMAYKWEVFFRLKDGVIGSKLFDTEPKADAFLAKLKGGKQ